MDRNSSNDNATAHKVYLVLIALSQMVLGAFALRATLVHTAQYPSLWQWRLDLAIATLLCISGLGLLRRRRWAIMLTTMFIYLAFLAILVTLSIGFERYAATVWYWLALLALPVLGACRLVVRDAAKYQ